jgi:D-galactose 1-dehydrogenase
MLCAIRRNRTVTRIRVGIVGIGKIARDQHIPSLRKNDAFKLVACASRHAKTDGLANFATLEAMLTGCPDLDAISICTPPQVHYDTAKLCLKSGKHVFLEKPPCATTAQLDRLAAIARESRCTLFQTWHSRYAPGVEPARRWLSSRKIRSVHVTWKEDVRQWHPGQTWIWEAGGFGVFDPGINAISILTQIIADPIFVTAANLFVPSNCASPIAADVAFAIDGGARISAALDFRHTGVQTWDIDVETDGGMLKLSAGGSMMSIDGATVSTPANHGPHGEYEALYRRFAELIAHRQSDVDGRPFQLVADIFLIGKRHIVEPFAD